MIIFGLVVVFLLVIILLLLIGWFITCLPDMLKNYDKAIDELRKRKERRNKIKEKKEMK